MSYEDRLRTAIYSSPSGAIFTLQFDGVERSGGKKAPIHEFPQQDVSDVQDLGNTTERFPMTVYFTGDNYDQQADAFWTALSEKGPGSLQHPRYGNIPVLPIAWSQTERFVEDVGRADFKVEFVRVQTAFVFPVTSLAAGEAILNATTAAIENGIATAASQFDLVNAADTLSVKNGILGALDDYNKFFGDIMAVSEEIQAEANQLVGDITNRIDQLLEAPAQLFTSLANLAALPARVFTNVVQKIQGYASQISSAVTLVIESYTQAVTVVQNIFSFFAGAAVASTFGTLDTRSEAVQAADQLEQITNTLTLIIESSENSAPGFSANQEVLSALIDAVAKARADLLERSYSLKSERRLTLSFERTPFDLLAEIYRDGGITVLDAQLDEFIRINGLQGDEIILVPTGREVVYYA
jgi:prophage DNA circulation protein